MKKYYNKVEVPSVHNPENILVTGGAGFIGSHFVKYLFGLSASGKNAYKDAGFQGTVVNVDNLTYCGNLDNLTMVNDCFGKGNKRYFFEKTTICDQEAIEKILKEYEIDTIVHFAAESHVDRSISNPLSFVKTNIDGTFSLLEAARNCWRNKDGTMRKDVRFHYVSTDEVFGSLSDEGFFSESSPLCPRSPYAASKAAGEHLAMAYHHTYGIPVTISNCSNNYGPYQYPEKFIPLMIRKIQKKESLPVYGKGTNIRDWIYVEDHNRAVWSILKKGTAGEKYIISAQNEWTNNELLSKLIEYETAVLQKKCKDFWTTEEIVKKIRHIEDRLGHDYRYAGDSSKIRDILGWKPLMTFEEGLMMTIEWYLNNPEWNRSCL